MKRKIGINADCISQENIKETIKKLKALGTDAFFVGGANPEIPEFKRLADEIGIDFEFVHAPWRGINAYWKEGEEYVPLDTEIKKCVDLVALAGVPTVIMHISSGWFPPPIGLPDLIRSSRPRCILRTI